MSTKKYVVAGSGFRGFCDAIELAKIPGAKVTIIESAPFFGGLMNSLEINGFYVDKGVHVFDSIPKDLAKIVTEIMEDQVEEVGFVSSSAFNGKVTEGFSLPDLNSLEDEAVKTQIKNELVEMSKSNLSTNAANLKELLELRYGKTAGSIFCDVFSRIYNIEAEEIEPSGLAQTSLGRLKFLDDPEMVALKQTNAWLDSVLAARRKSMGKVDDFVSIYPSDGRAMKGWCERAKVWLEKAGIEVRLGEKISRVEKIGNALKITTDKSVLDADKLVWTNDNLIALSNATGVDSGDLGRYRHGTPMLFITMMTQKDKIKDFTYLQNFNPAGLTYRTAAAGIFSYQSRDGISFITSECPAIVDGDYWKDADKAVKKAWEEVKGFGIVDSSAELVGSNVIRLPETFKLAKVGFTEKFNEFEQRLSAANPNIVLRSLVPFFRREIYFDSLKIRELV